MARAGVLPRIQSQAAQQTGAGGWHQEVLGEEGDCREVYQIRRSRAVQGNSSYNRVTRSCNKVLKWLF